MLTWEMSQASSRAAFMPLPVRGVTPCPASPTSSSEGPCSCEACTRMPDTASGRCSSWAAN